MPEMTVVEAYIKFNGQLIILISGLPGCGKSKISKKISELFKIQHMSLRQFIKEDFDKTVELANGSKVIDWDDEEAYDWDKFNSKINEVKSDGVIVSGFAFPSENIKFEVDNHVNIKISKQKYITCRHEFLTKNKDKNTDLFDLIDSPTESLTINKLIYPHYLEYTQKSTVNKFFNGNEMSSDDIFSEIFDYLIEDIQEYLKKRNSQNRSTSSVNNKKDDSDSSDSSNESNIIDIDESSSSSEPYILATVNPNDETLQNIQ